MKIVKPSEVALQRSLSDVVAEYDAKLAVIPEALKIFNKAGGDLTMAATVGGTYGRTQLNVGSIYERDLRMSLLKSAWHHVYDGLNIKLLSSPTDKRLFEQTMADPPPFTLDNIRGTFSKFVADPRGNVLRGLAEVFCGLDDAFKSHDKMKIGVAGLPKRVVVGYVDDYGSHGKDKIESILNALATYQGKPLVEWREISALLKDEEALLKDGALPADRTWEKPFPVVGRGIRLRRFKNKNAHMFFEPKELRDVNMALAEFYGEVLPDTPDENPKKKPGTAVSKDLQYYPTPVNLVERIIGNLYHLEGARVLEPSCGCGRFMDALRKAKAKPYGVEVDPRRAAECKAKGHVVLVANFLETAPTGDFDLVVMNPPFYGKHYARHVRHAFEFLKPGGKLIAILPATARYDHGLLDDLGTAPSGDRKWDDLPVGSFSESGTNINTTVLTIFKKETT